MKISFNWVKEYANVDLAVEKVAEILTSTGLEIETIEPWSNVKRNFENVVVGEVITCTKHPDADKLSLCSVDAGEEDLLNIICGAPNIAKGQKVIVAKVGAILHPYGEPKPFEIKKAKIRGIQSEGMICAEDEIGIGDSHEGIVVLPDDTKVGTAVSEIFKVENDYILEVGLTPNRSDAMSHIGVARDLIAALAYREKMDINLNIPPIEPPKQRKPKLPIKITIENNEACSRYTGLTISGISVAPSPDWLKNRLNAVGIKPLNNVVDVTNYVMLEVGLPLHAFDYDKIEGAEIVVKNLPAKTPFTTLDGVNRELTADDMMICDAVKPMCIAGVYGGVNSGITDETKNIFIESAWFYPVSVRKTAKTHQLSTDASFRFERGADPAITTYALVRVANLIVELAGGEIASNIVDEGIFAEFLPTRKIDLRIEKLNATTGVKITDDEVEKILSLLDFVICKKNDGVLTLSVPTYRADVTREIDVIEEVLRIYGLDSIPVPDTVPIAFPITPQNPADKIIAKLGDFLTANGFYEVWNNSLTAAKVSSAIKSNDDNLAPVTLLNPLSADLDTMRTDMLPGLLENIKHNVNRQKHDLRLFEYGSTYFKKQNVDKAQPVSKQFVEKPIFAFVATGKTIEESWREAQKEINIYDIKAYIEAAIKISGISNKRVSFDNFNDDKFAEGGTILVDNNIVGEFGEVAKEKLKLFGLKQSVYYAVLFIDSILAQTKRMKKVAPLPKYPEVHRDLSLIIDKSVKFATLKEAIEKVSPLIRDIKLFDVFISDNLSEGKISYAVSFTLRHDDKTLSDKEIDKVMSKVIATLVEMDGVELRQ